MLAANIENQAASPNPHPLVLCLNSGMAVICMKCRKKYFLHYGKQNLKSSHLRGGRIQVDTKAMLINANTG